MFCTNVKYKLKALLQGFDQYANVQVELALMVTAELKKIVNSNNAADILPAIIPTELDNMVRLRLLKALNITIDALTVSENYNQCCNLEAKLKCFVEQLGKLEPNMQDALLHKLASLIAYQLDGKRLKQSLYDLYTQVKYNVRK